MSGPEHGKADDKAAKGGSKGGSPMTAGKVFAIPAAAGLAFYIVCLFVSMGVMALGAAKRTYPEVVLGLVAFVLAAAAIINSFTKD